jgi:hypothetical protein
MARITLVLDIMTGRALCQANFFRKSCIFAAFDHPIPTERMPAMYKFVVLFNMTFATKACGNLSVHPFVFAPASVYVEIFKLHAFR